jgi:hypothetical protein
VHVFTCCWSVKGGSGVTVVAAAVALAASATGRVALVDLCGDLPTALGLAEPDGPGVAEWSRGCGDAPPRATSVPATSLSLVPRGRGPLGTLREVDLAPLADDVVVDAGCLDRADGPRATLASRAERSLLVTRACYLGLRRAATFRIRPHGVVVLTEPGRVLRADDVASVIGAPIVAEIPVDASISRVVDAGMLTSRRPSSLLDPLRALR